MKKGFTLIELLAVIIILGVIALITFPVIDNSIKKSKEEALQRTIDAIRQASYEYSVNNDIGYPSIDAPSSLSLDDLKSAGFIEKDLINPVTDEKMSGCIWYYYDDNSKQYNFQYDEECSGPLIPPNIAITYDKSLLTNGWLKANMLVNIVSNGDSIKYCLSDKDCEPSIEEKIPTYSVGISNEGTNVLCAIASNELGTTNKICETLKLDKTPPTISGVADLVIERNSSINLATGITYSDALSDISGNLIITPAVLDTSVAGTKQVKYQISDNAGNIREVIRNIIVEAEAPTITFALLDANSINSNGWAKSNFYVRATITDNSGTGIKSAASCTTNSTGECTPTGTFTGTIKDNYITTEGNNRICIQVTDNRDKTTKICSDTYKLDKTKPVVGTVNISGTKGNNDWYTSNVTISVNPGYDSLSGHADTTINTTSITSNTVGYMVIATTTDLAGNVTTWSTLVKVDKNAPSLSAKTGTVEIEEGTNNVTSNYFTVSYSTSGGTLSCSPTTTASLTAGSHILNCTATGGNGKTAISSKQITVKNYSLISTLLGQYVSIATTGLLKDETRPNIYYYKGNNNQVRNNLWYGGHHWRVVEFDTSAKTLTLVAQQSLSSIKPSTSIWTTSTQYNNSYINKWLNSYFYGTLPTSVQNNIVYNTFNIGLYPNVANVTTSQRVGLLDQNQYDRAGGYMGFLNTDEIAWLGSTYKSIDNEIGITTYNQSIQGRSYGVSGAVRPVIKIKDINVYSGNGTFTSHYKTNDKSTSTSNVLVGEHINVPTSGSDCGTDKLCNFKVISRNGSAVKVILNGVLPQRSIFGSTGNFSSSSTIYSRLNTFANTISTTFRYTGTQPFYKAAFPASFSTAYNYESIKNESYSSSFGLPVIGEIFGGNDIDINSYDYYYMVDKNTLENPEAESFYDYFWLMSRTTENSNNVCNINTNGIINDIQSTYDYYVRPVIFLKTGLTFKSGDGTPQNPYKLQ